jgi:hypothetical protein
LVGEQVLLTQRAPFKLITKREVTDGLDVIVGAHKQVVAR